MFFTLGEFFDACVMSAALGFIFSDLARRFRPHKDPLYELQTNRLEDFKFALYATVPAVLMHELGHKFVALGFGMQATFHAAYVWLAIGMMLRLINFPFIFFVPAFVSISGMGTPLSDALIAFAGPLVNGLLWLGAYLALKHKHTNKKHYELLYLTKQINMFLFIFNMIPIPGFDGYTFFSSLIGILH